MLTTQYILYCFRVLLVHSVKKVFGFLFLCKVGTLFNSDMA